MMVVFIRSTLVKRIVVFLLVFSLLLLSFPALPLPAVAIGAVRDLNVVNVSSGSVQISWQPIAGATGYNIYRSDQLQWTFNSSTEKWNKPSANFSRLNPSPISQTTYTDTGLNNDTTYYYLVRAYDGSSESSDSNVVSATPPTLKQDAAVASNGGYIYQHPANSASDKMIDGNPTTYNSAPYVYNGSGIIRIHFSNRVNINSLEITQGKFSMYMTEVVVRTDDGNENIYALNNASVTEGGLGYWLGTINLNKKTSYVEIEGRNSASHAGGTSAPVIGRISAWTTDALYPYDGPDDVSRINIQANFAATDGVAFGKVGSERVHANSNTRFSEGAGWEYPLIPTIRNLKLDQRRLTVLGDIYPYNYQEDWHLYQGALNESITESTTTINLNSGSDFDTYNPVNRIRIDDEEMKITAVSGSAGNWILTVLRGQDGSVASSHIRGSDVKHLRSVNRVNLGEQVLPEYKWVALYDHDLASDLAPGGTTLSYRSGSYAANNYIMIADEYMKVLAVDTLNKQLTVERNVLGSPAAMVTRWAGNPIRKIDSSLIPSTENTGDYNWAFFDNELDFIINRHEQNPWLTMVSPDVYATSKGVIESTQTDLSSGIVIDYTKNWWPISDVNYAPQDFLPSISGSLAALMTSEPAGTNSLINLTNASLFRKNDVLAVPNRSNSARYELMKVTNVSSTTNELLVERGYQNSATDAHDMGATVSILKGKQWTNGNLVITSGAAKGRSFSIVEHSGSWIKVNQDLNVLGVQPQDSYRIIPASTDLRAPSKENWQRLIDIYYVSIKHWLDRYPDRKFYVEFWIEPNLPIYGHFSAAAYIDFYLAMSKALRTGQRLDGSFVKVDGVQQQGLPVSRIKIGAGAMSGGLTNTWRNETPYSFYKQLLQSPFIDFVSHHNYGDVLTGNYFDRRTYRSLSWDVSYLRRFSDKEVVDSELNIVTGAGTGNEQSVSQAYSQVPFWGTAFISHFIGKNGQIGRQSNMLQFLLQSDVASGLGFFYQGQAAPAYWVVKLWQENYVAGSSVSPLFIDGDPYNWVEGTALSTPDKKQILLVNKKATPIQVSLKSLGVTSVSSVRWLRVNAGGSSQTVSDGYQPLSTQGILSSNLPASLDQAIVIEPFSFNLISLTLGQNSEPTLSPESSPVITQPPVEPPPSIGSPSAEEVIDNPAYQEALDTNISISARYKKANRGRKALITGRLKDKNGNALANKKVVIRAKILRNKKYRWQTIGIATTNNQGIFTLSYRTHKKAFFKAYFRGDSLYNPSLSNTLIINAKKQ